MALTSASTFDDAYAQLNNNLDWPGYPARARLWLEAARWLLGNRPQFSMSQNSQVNWAPFTQEIERAHDYLMGTDATTQTVSSPFVRARPR